mmetsp:Transcript_153215/g.491334  ORF Transcript_153215/g.491334 Transcript_153215/m.491334 type:complete len:522 (+) Transcript_153215:114-1679(+)
MLCSSLWHVVLGLAWGLAFFAYFDSAWLDVQIMSVVQSIGQTGDEHPSLAHGEHDEVDPKGGTMQSNSGDAHPSIAPGKDGEVDSQERSNRPSSGPKKRGSQVSGLRQPGRGFVSESRGVDEHCNASALTSGSEALRDALWHVAGPNYSFPVEDGSPGTYDGCHAAGKGVFWVYLIGQIRSFGMHSTNFRTFLSDSHTCWFVVLYTRTQIAAREKARPWSPKVDGALDELVQIGQTVQTIISDVAQKLHRTRPGSNLACVIVNYPNRSHEQHRAVTLLGREVAMLHCIPRHDLDVIAVTRPDMIFSSAINVPRIADVMSRLPHMLLTRHQEIVGGNDPSELLIVGPRKFWEATCAYADANSSSTLTSAPGNSSSTLSSGPGMLVVPKLGLCLEPREARKCGWFAAHLVYSAFAMGVMPFFIGQPLAINLHRINGHFHMGVMNGFTKQLPQPNHPVRSTLDITQHALCVVGEFTACASGRHKPREPAPLSRCWGQTRWTILNPQGGLWVCKTPSDIDRACDR